MREEVEIEFFGTWIGVWFWFTNAQGKYECRHYGVRRDVTKSSYQRLLNVLKWVPPKLVTAKAMAYKVEVLFDVR